MIHSSGHVSFHPENMCDFQRGSEQKVMISTSGPAAEFRMPRMDAPSKVSMKGIGVSSKRSYQRPQMTEQVQKPKFGGQFRTQTSLSDPAEFEGVY